MTALIHHPLDEDCRKVSQILARIGEKWSMLVVMLLREGPRRFNDIKRNTGGISQQMLTRTLRGLERDGMVTRTIFPTSPPQVEYDLTELGRSMSQPVLAFGQWVQEHLAEIDVARDRFDQRAAGALLRAPGVAETGAAALDEFLDAEIVVIGAPMYNFTIPSQLKAWIDHIIIAGKTFRYSETGAEGLAGGKKVIIASSRGGLYAPGTPQAANDFQERYLRTVLGFIGIEDIDIVRAEGLGFGPEQREAAMRAALASVPSVVAGLVPAKAA